MTNIIPFNNKTNFKNVIASTTDGQKRLYRVPKRVLPAISTPTKVRLFHLIRAFILFLWKHAFNVETLHLEIWKIRTTTNSCYCFIDGLTRILNHRFYAAHKKSSLLEVSSTEAVQNNLTQDRIRKFLV